MTMVLGVGAGTFAVLLTIGVCVFFGLLGAYFAPQAALYILLGCVLLPLIVYGCILTAPHGPAADTGTTAAVYYYRERQLPANTDVIDKYLPVRIVVFIVLALGTLAAIVFQILLLCSSPPYETPRVRCLREQLEEAHPTWYR
ncbi:hypothetical protein ABB37_08200 [Leptomonas pyrrhocoris]|uniref:Transmembrane protein n=1 Tax=Leptomonas pyrrhocoris TaxID=157538 RepID=A0A0N0DSG8_LEPPY|nr:hypothetical protein ABB37_08200 [Leptomonas pyrrhocoris]KPA76068.1 hypothetical protein ABB37_08200 [Leptomonas pyrrhocoris]|eukprot:XP_015654507.1 hypothetical protein ABB37_08200 [Leptomonas pyrrhocoris]